MKVPSPRAPLSTPTNPPQILNPRVGMLSNHEVLTHITAMKARYTDQHLRHGGTHAMKAENLETVMKEVPYPPPLPPPHSLTHPPPLGPRVPPPHTMREPNGRADCGVPEGSGGVRAGEGRADDDDK